MGNDYYLCIKSVCRVRKESMNSVAKYDPSLFVNSLNYRLPNALGVFAVTVIARARQSPSL
jgi:hypothetical protein